MHRQWTAAGGTLRETAMRCPRCGENNPPGARFCPHCGAPVGPTCLACGAGLPTGAKFCSGCGRPVDATPSPASYTPRHLSEQILSLRGVIEGERKQVTVLFCDIVESTPRAASLGPEGFHELVDR